MTAESPFCNVAMPCLDPLQRGAPYNGVDPADADVERIVASRGRMLDVPFDAGASARLARIEDAVGAHLGLWQPIRASPPVRGR